MKTVKAEQHKTSGTFTPSSQYFKSTSS